MQAIERIRLPKPDTHCFDTDTDTDVWSYSPELVRETVLAHIDKLEAEVERLRKDAESWRKFQRDQSARYAAMLAKINEGTP